ncbi:MAG TPA: Do family serine endopeptidase [Acetobacteraceae bacterium]|nr:Do family serine endopeptidase [Acetobacteraceae bacterium]
MPDRMPCHAEGFSPGERGVQPRRNHAAMIRTQRLAARAHWTLRDQFRTIAIMAQLLLGACSATPYHADARPTPDSFAPLVKRVLPAVVNIAVTETVSGNDIAAELPPELRDTPLGREFRRRFGNHHEQMMAAGSGFLIDPSGIIVTNNHVVDHANKIVVSLADGRQFPAHVLGTDEPTDVAVIKIDAPGRLASVPWGNSRQVEVGDWILAAGNPFGLGGSVTAGIVSAEGRDLGSSPFDSFLQLDAPINPGNSGGPLFNQSGRVIGIDTAIYSPSGGSVGIGFAIPSNLASNVVTQLREHGVVKRGWLGIQMQAMTPALAKAVGLPKNEGVLVDEITPNSPAAKADLRQGDVITGYNGETIHTPRDLAMAVAGTQAGSTMKLSLWRSTHAMTVDVAIGTQQPEKTAQIGEKTGEAPVGMALAQLTPDSRQQFGIDPAVKGVIVAEVTPNSKAANSGMRPGDVIERIGPHAVATPGQAVSDIHAAEKANKNAVPVLVSRNGSPYYLALQLANG